MRNRAKKEKAKQLADEEEAKKPKIIPHWKKSFLAQREAEQKKLRELEPKIEEAEQAATVGTSEVKTDDEIEEDLENPEPLPKKILQREASEYSEISEDVINEDETDITEIEEELAHANLGKQPENLDMQTSNLDMFTSNLDMQTVKLKIEHQKGLSVSQLVDHLRDQWHRDFKDYNIEKIENGQDFDVYSVSLKVPKTILPEHYFVYKGRRKTNPNFRNLVLIN